MKETVSGDSSETLTSRGYGWILTCFFNTCPLITGVSDSMSGGQYKFNSDFHREEHISVWCDPCLS